MSKKQPGSNPLVDPTMWVDQHGDSLFRYALTRVGNSQVAEDLVQETFLAALRGSEDFAGKSAERSWLVGILKHKIVDHYRHQGREHSVQAANPSEEGIEGLFDQKGWWKIKPTKWVPPPSEMLERKEFWEIFRRCLQKLPQRLAAAFSLREMDELDTDEVSDILSVTAGNLGVMLYRARMNLRRCLEIN